jgi:hypothetical protein
MNCGLRISDCGLNRHLQQEPIVRNEPNFSGRPRSRRTRCAKRTQSGPAWAGRGPQRTKDAKRTQFASGGAGMGAGARGREGPRGPIV